MPVIDVLCAVLCGHSRLEGAVDLDAGGGNIRHDDGPEDV